MAGQGSARVTLKEIDLSQVSDPEQLPQGVPAAVVGTAKRGPAFVPKTFATIQQFNETFGSLSEVSKESNSNRFGPIALNEWMRNAQAGTFLRVLGVGDGTGQKDSTSGKVQGAGFVVGEKVSHDASNDLQFNPFASYESGHEEASKVTSKKAGRTYFLGSFMKDVGNSTLLQDAGIQLQDAQGQLVIDLSKLTVLPSEGSTIVVKDGKKEGGGDFIIVFHPVGQADAVSGDLKIDTNGLNKTTLASAINQGIFDDVNTNFSASLSDDADGNTTIITLTATEDGAAGNFNVELTMEHGTNRDQVEVRGLSTITNSTLDEEIRMDDGGTTSASIEIEIVDPADPNNLHTTNQLTLKALKDDRTVATQLIKFADDALMLATQTAAGAINDSGLFIFVSGNALFVRLGENGLNTLEGQKETLSNLASALNAENGSDVEGLLVATLSNSGQKLTISQKNKGNVDNTANVAVRCDARFVQGASDPGDTSFTINGTSVDTDPTKDFTGGTDGNGTITFELSGQPAIGDNFTLIAEDSTSEEFIFIANNNGNSNGVDAGGKIQIELSSLLSGTAENINDAILADDSAVKNKFTSSFTSTSVTITQVTAGPAGDTLVEFNLNENVKAKTSSNSLTGNFGKKLNSFKGGGGSASPVARGVLMTPQGVLPAIDVVDSNSTYSGLFQSDGTTAVSSEDNVRSTITETNGTAIKNFAADNTTSLIGYQLGKVSDITGEQTFTLLLNGFKNKDEPAILTCSFNPESVNYFGKVLNTDPEKIEEKGHYLYASWDIDPRVATTDSTGINLSDGSAADGDVLAFCVASSHTERAEADNRPNFEAFDTRFTTAQTPWIVSQKFGSVSHKLFKLYSLDDGSVGNDRFRVLISNIRAGSTQEDYGLFDLALESYYSDPITGSALIEWKNLTLDPDSRNFIGRVIGDKHVYYDFDRSLNKQRLVETGNFEVRNSYVRVEMTDDVQNGEVDITSLPCGFSEYKTLNITSPGLFTELGDNKAGQNPVLAPNVFDTMRVSPLPFVRTITRGSGDSVSASSALPWGVKFAKRLNPELNGELGEIRFDKSIRSWSKFFPELGANDTRKFAKNSSESFSLENIAVDDADNIDWSSSRYVRSGLESDASAISKEFIKLGSAASVGKNVRYLKFRCIMQGGFDGLNIFNSDKADLNTSAATREALDESGDLSFTGPTVEAYKRAIDVLADKSATEFQLLALPGIREPLVTDYAVTSCESRFDAMFLMDIQEVDQLNALILSSSAKPSVENIITKFSDRVLDTSFAAAYFPDVLTRRPSNNTPIQVPPSVCMLGVMSQNDTLADPWFAPAGLRRGRLNAINSKVQMNRDTLDSLYDVDINPIYEPAGRAGQVYAFGQKTLLQSQSALDRINVRRLLINLRRKVKAVANTLLFEPNRESTLNKFNALVEPIMAEVQARQGIVRYKVQIDTSTTTQNDVENNTIRGKIYLQPTKTIEFISLDFVVTNSID